MGNSVKGGETQQPSCQKDPNPYQAYILSDQEKTIINLKVSRDKLLSQKHALYQNANKAHNEAKVLIKQGRNDHALFAFKRKKLYENMVMGIEKQETIIEKIVIDVEGKIQLSEYTNVLKKTNDLIESLDTATKLEALQQIGQDVRQREMETREFNKLFEEHNVNDSGVNDLFKQFEAEVNPEGSSLVKYYVRPQVQEQEQQEQQKHQEQQLLLEQQQQLQQQPSPRRQTHNRELSEEEIAFYFTMNMMKVAAII